MARIAAAVLGIVALAASVPGCNSASRRGSSEPFRYRDSTAFTERRDPIETSGSSRSTADVERRIDIAPRPSRTPADPTTMAMIDRELAGVPEAERRDLAEQLQTLDPMTAEKVLNAFRARRQLEAARSAPDELADSPPPSRLAAANGGHAGVGNIIRTGGELPSLDRMPGAEQGVQTAGLGRTSPWGSERMQEAESRTVRRPAISDRWPVDPAAVPVTPPRNRLEELNRRLGGSNSPASLPRPIPTNQSRSLVTAPGQPVRTASVADVLAATPRHPEVDPLPRGDAETTRTHSDEPGRVTPAVAMTPSLEMSERFDTRSPSGDANEPASADAELQRLIDLIERDPATAEKGETDAARNEYVKRQLHLRMLHVIAGHGDRAFTSIPGLETREAEFAQHTLWALADYVDYERFPRGREP